jgi:SAM-dependent methyltransferase
MTAPTEPHDETRAVAERYARRAGDDRHAPHQPAVQQLLAERQQAMRALLAEAGLHDLAALRLLEVGCGAGDNLRELIAMGFQPAHLAGIELLPDRLALARQALPAVVRLQGGDASVAPVASGSLDIVYASTVFSSLLDDAFQQRLAGAMWQWLKPGGAVLWYDFTVDNPRNRDVRGVPPPRLQALFPQGTIRARRVTLAPPLARLVCRVHPGLYPLVNRITPLRTHLLAWISKPAA